jgi:hypothetical protein
VGSPRAIGDDVEPPRIPPGQYYERGLTVRLRVRRAHAAGGVAVRDPERRRRGALVDVGRERELSQSDLAALSGSAGAPSLHGDGG